MTLLTGLLALFLSAASDINQSKIDDVKSGKISEARASWWGFHETDSTSSLQSAINSGAKRVIVEDMGKPWIVTPLNAVSDQEIVFEKGVVLLAKKGEFKKINESLLSVQFKRNVTITGYGATFRMHRDDYAKPPYKKAEWRHTLQINSCSNVKVSGLTLVESGGDGIYLGVASKGVTNEKIHIRDVVLRDHYRQGISVITAENLLIENVVMRTTEGTLPMAGIDFEPNTSGEKLVNCVLRNCVSENNAGPGYLFALAFMSEKSEPVSIRLEKCIAKGPAPYPLRFDSREGGEDGPQTGLIEWVDCEFSGDVGPAITVERKPARGVKMRFVDCKFIPRNHDPKTPSILFKSAVGCNEDTGGVHFENCVVHTREPRPVVAFEDPTANLRLIDVTGTLKIRTGTGDDQRESRLKLTQQWLDEQHPGNAFTRFPRVSTHGMTFQPLHKNVEMQGLSLQPFKNRFQGTLVLFAEEGKQVKLKLRHMQMGKHPGETFVVTAVSPGGPSLNVGEVPFQKTALLSFIAPETGLYRIPIQCGVNAFELMSINCPTCFSSEDRRLSLTGTAGDLSFLVPAGTLRFGVKVMGENQESLGVQILNPSGDVVWNRPTVTMPEQFVGIPKSDQNETWTLRISRPASGRLEDHYLQLQGIPPFFATHPSCLLKPSP